MEDLSEIEPHSQCSPRAAEAVPLAARRANQASQGATSGSAIVTVPPASDPLRSTVVSRAVASLSSDSGGPTGAERRWDPTWRSAPPQLRGEADIPRVAGAGWEAALRLGVALAEGHLRVYRRVVLSPSASVADAAVIAHRQARRLKLAPNAFLTAAESDGGQARDLFAALNALDVLAIEYADGQRSVKALRERAADLGLAWFGHDESHGDSEPLVFSYDGHSLHVGHHVSVVESRRQSAETLRVHIALADGRPDGPELGMYVGVIEAPGGTQGSA